MTAGGRLAPALAPVAAGLAAAAALHAAAAQGGALLVPMVVAGAGLAAVIWAFVDLERFVVVGCLVAMAFPQALASPAGARIAGADLLLLLAAGVWLARIAVGTGPPPFVARNPILLPAVALTAVTAASLAWSLDPRLTAKNALQMVELAVVVPLLFASLPVSMGQIRRGLQLYVAATTVIAAVAAVGFAASAASGQLAPQYLAGVHKNALGSFLGAGLVIAYALSLDRSRSFAARRLLELAALVELAGLFATVSRGAIVGGLLSLLVVAALLRRARLRTLLLVVGSAVFFWYVIQAPLSDRIERLGGYETTVVRLRSYQNAIEKIRDAPLLGSGAGTYFDELPEFGGALTDPHNLVLLTWAELGVAGLVALFLLLVRYGRVLMRSRRLPPEARPVAVAAGTAALSLFVHFQFDAGWTGGNATLCFALVGLALASARLGRVASRAPQPPA